LPFGGVKPQGRMLQQRPGLLLKGLQFRSRRLHLFSAEVDVAEGDELAGANLAGKAASRIVRQPMPVACQDEVVGDYHEVDRTRCSNDPPNDEVTLGGPSACGTPLSSIIIFVRN